MSFDEDDPAGYLTPSQENTSGEWEKMLKAAVKDRRLSGTAHAARLFNALQLQAFSHCLPAPRVGVEEVPVEECLGILDRREAIFMMPAEVASLTPAALQKPPNYEHHGTGLTDLGSVASLQRIAQQHIDLSTGAADGFGSRGGGQQQQQQQFQQHRQLQGRDRCAGRERKGKD